MNAWTNDYGDIPRWYWVPRAVWMRQALRDTRRWSRHSSLWMAMAVATWAR